MKLFQKKSVWIMTSFILFIGYWESCTKNDQVLQQGTTTSNGTTLVSLKVTSAPTIDGVIDPMWDNATKLNVVPQVPDPGNGLFAGYIGETYPATLRSMLSLIHISEPTRLGMISYAVFCLKKKKN